MRSVGFLAALVVAGEAAAFAPLDPAILLQAIAADAAFVDRLGAEAAVDRLGAEAATGDGRGATRVAVDQRAMRNAWTSGTASICAASPARCGIAIVEHAPVGARQATAVDLAIGGFRTVAADAAIVQAAHDAPVAAAASTDLPALATGAPILLANLSSGGGTAQANALALSLSLPPGPENASARTVVHQTQSDRQLTRHEGSAPLRLSAMLRDGSGIAAVNQAGGQGGLQANAIAIGRNAGMR